MKIGNLALIVLLCGSSFGHSSVLANSSFESESLSPWYLDREFGSNRGWGLSTSEPHSGSRLAFNLGQIELRQDFTPILGSQIQRFSFYAGHQFPDRGNPWVEIFYSEGGGSGEIEIELNPERSWQSQRGWVWDEFDILDQVDLTREVSGFSIVGIPNNVLRLDTVSLVAVPEPNCSLLLLLAGGISLLKRSRSNKTQHHKSDRAGGSKA